MVLLTKDVRESLSGKNNKIDFVINKTPQGVLFIVECFYIKNTTA